MQYLMFSLQYSLKYIQNMFCVILNIVLILLLYNTFLRYLLLKLRQLFKFSILI